MCHFSQKTQNLDLGVFAALQPMMDFQHHLVGEEERGVALSGANTMDIGCREYGFGAEGVRRRERNSAALAGVQPLAAPERRQHRWYEAIARIRLIEHTGPAAAAQPRGGIGDGRPSLPLRFGRKGHEIGLDPTAGQFDIEDRENKAALATIAEYRKILHRDAGDWRLVWTKPAPRGQKAGGDRALECDEFTPGENRFELAGGNQRE